MPRLITHAVLFLAVTGSLFAGQLYAEDPKLKSGDFVAVIGDSITEQKQYSVYVEDYLLMCQPVEKLRITQFGWSGETAAGFERRMVNDLLRFKPSVATTCFGMNDGGYSAMNPDKAKGYRDNQTKIVKKCKEAGVRTIVGSPGVVDSDTYHKDKPGDAELYNKTLADERDISREVAQAEGVAFADVYGAMMDAMIKAKVKNGKGYHVAGGDGVHPSQNGQLIMAYAFLKALGCNGDIGTINVDLAGDKADATSGHKVKSCSKGEIEIESSRYPFCFYGDPGKPEATTGIIEFFPFNSDLNRLTLAVKGATAENYDVTWGKTTKKFTGKQLTDGINLAAEFLVNPFLDPFLKVEQKIREQQNFETPMIKSLITRLPELKSVMPGDAETLEKVVAHAMERDDVLAKASSEAFKPVTHTIKIEAAK